MMQDRLRQLPALQAPLPDFDTSAMPPTPQEAFALLQAQPDYVVVGWRVYAVNPAVVEFWQSASNHIRWRYARNANGSWSTAQLWP